MNYTFHDSDLVALPGLGFYAFRLTQKPTKDRTKAVDFCFFVKPNQSCRILFFSYLVFRHAAHMTPCKAGPFHSAANFKAVAFMHGLLFFPSSLLHLPFSLPRVSAFPSSADCRAAPPFSRSSPPVRRHQSSVRCAHPYLLFPLIAAETEHPKPSPNPNASYLYSDLTQSRVYTRTVSPTFDFLIP